MNKCDDYTTMSFSPFDHLNDLDISDSTGQASISSESIALHVVEEALASDFSVLMQDPPFYPTITENGSSYNLEVYSSARSSTEMSPK